MENNEKFLIQRKTRLRYQRLRLITGFCSLFTDLKKSLIASAYIVLACIFWTYKATFIYMNNTDMFGFANKFMVELIFPFILIGGFLALLVLLGTPIGAKEINERLLRTGLINHAGETPLLINKSFDRKTGVTIMEFESNGIPLYAWEDSKENIEAILNVNIIEIRQGRKRNRIILKTVSGDMHIPTIANWRDEYLSYRDFEIILGRGLIEDVTIDLNTIPHILIGGSTGSGKSVLLKHLLLQCVRKGAKVHIADFKGGIDFCRPWREKCVFITDKHILSNDLDDIIRELEMRKQMLNNFDCANISELNQKQHTQLQRIIFACDEVAELLDKTGASKEDKELIAQIENKLSVIARQGRAFGIHLILATQRPDANILTGQIRNNIDFRVCGRADNVLSQIILDSTDAAEQIPKYEQGLFLTNTGKTFRGYLFDENSL